MEFSESKHIHPKPLLSATPQESTRGGEEDGSSPADESSDSDGGLFHNTNHPPSEPIETSSSEESN
jgi:hypothetical protein